MARRTRRIVGLACLDGGVAQLGEHLLCKQGVIGSIPIVSTRGVSTKGASAAGAFCPRGRVTQWHVVQWHEPIGDGMINSIVEIKSSV